MEKRSTRVEELEGKGCWWRMVGLGYKTKQNKEKKNWGEIAARKRGLERREEAELFPHSQALTEEARGRSH